MHARIRTHNRSFVHAETPDGERVFIHFRACDFDLREARVGDLLDVEFEPDGTRGPRAQSATWVERGVDLSVDEVIGTVVLVRPDFVFLRPDDDGGADLFCHVRNFADWNGGNSATLTAVQLGARLRCGRRASARGPRGERVEPA